MSGEPVSPSTGDPDRGSALVGRRVAYGFAVVLSAAVRVLVVMRLLRRFIMFPLLLAMIGGLGAAIVFASGEHWRDASRAGLVAFMCALLLAVYSMAAVWIDPEHFNDRTVPSWRRL